MLAAVVSLVATSRQDARDATRRWGVYHEVVVAGSDVAIGTPAAVADLVLERRPTALVPEDALRAIPSDDDRITTSLSARQVVTTRDLALLRPPGVAPPPGTRAITIPSDRGTPPARAGDLVDIVLFGDVFGPVVDDQVLEPPGVVLRVEEEAVTLAVEPEQVAPIARGLAAGRVALAVR